MSCKKEKNKEALSIYSQSMELHDEIMSRMDEMLSMRRQLINRLDSLNQDSLSNASSIRELRAANVALIRSDEMMMSWMRNIKDVPGANGELEHAQHGDHGDHEEHEDASPVNEQQTIQIQQNQKAAIMEIKKELLKSIEDAKNILAKND